MLATADPPDHTRQRKVVSRRLSTTVMQEMEPEFRELVDHTLDVALASGRIEWMSQLAEPLPMIMVARILGLPDDDAPRTSRSRATRRWKRSAASSPRHAWPNSADR